MSTITTIACDLDGCLANFTKSYGDCLIQVGGNLLPDGWRNDPDFPKTWYWDREAGYRTEVETEVWQNHIMQPGSKFWQNLEPLPYARETLLMLNSRQKRGDQVWFVSHRMGDRAHLQTLTWLYNHGMDYPQLVFAEDKVPVLRLLKPNFFIDDKPSTCEAVEKASKQEGWKNFQNYCKDAPYNRKDRPSGLKVAGSVKEALEGAGLWIS